jgi:hypothetical protein
MGQTNWLLNAYADLRARSTSFVAAKMLSKSQKTIIAMAILLMPRMLM